MKKTLKPAYAWGYFDKDTYEPIRFIGKFWGDDFLPITGHRHLHAKAMENNLNKTKRAYHRKEPQRFPQEAQSSSSQQLHSNR